MSICQPEHFPSVPIGDEFVSSPDYKTLYATFDGVREIDQGPLVVVDGGNSVIEARG